MRNICTTWLLGALAFLLCTAQAHAAEAQTANPSARWGILEFSEAGHEEVRQALSGWAKFEELRTWVKPPDPPVKQLIASAPLCKGSPPLVLVIHEGLYVCGTHGCPLSLLRQDKLGEWSEVLDTLGEAGLVASGPRSSNGCNDLVLLGLPTDGFACPVWRFNGRRYDYAGQLSNSTEPCHSLVNKGVGFAR